LTDSSLQMLVKQHIHSYPRGHPPVYLTGPQMWFSARVTLTRSGNSPGRLDGRLDAGPERDTQRT